MLAEPDGVEAVELDLWDDGVASTPMEKKVALALELERPGACADPRVRQVSSADYSDSRVEVALATTTGISSYRRRTIAFLSVDAIAGEGADTQTGGGIQRRARAERARAGRGDGRRGAAGDPHARRAEGALGALHGRLRSPGGLDLAGCVASALSGEALVKGRSFFAGRVGEPVAAPTVTLVDDPTDPRAFGAATHDGEGLACRRNVLIEGGVLRKFVFDTVSARRAGAVSTGSAVRGGFAGTPSAGCRALVLAPGSRGRTRSWPRWGRGSTSSR